MSCAHSVARSASRSCARAVNARHNSSYPSSLALLWPLKLGAAGVLKSAKGPAPVFSDTPTVTADGVTPGDGPTWEGWSPDASGGCTRVMRWTPDTASADITDDVELGGGFWATSTGLEFRDGTNVASVATSWEASTTEVPVVVTAVVQATDDGKMCITRVTGASPYPRIFALSRSVKNLLKNSEFAGTGTTPTGWSLYINNGSAAIIPSTVFDGENALELSVTSGRIVYGYTPPAGTFVNGHRYILGCYVESARDSSPLAGGIQLIATGGTTLTLLSGIMPVHVADGTQGFVWAEFVAGETLNMGPRFGIGPSNNSRGSIVISRPFLVDVTGSIEAVYPHEYIKTASTDTSGLAASVSGYVNTPNISMWGDSLLANSSIVTYLQAHSQVGIYNGGIGGEGSVGIKARFDALPNKYGDFNVFWVGRNNFQNKAQVLSDIDGMVSALGHTKYIVVSVLKRLDGADDATELADIDELNADLSGIYGDRYLNVQDLLADLATRSDGLHLNSYGSIIAATAIMYKIGLPVPWTPFDGTMPALALADSAPGSLLEVQEWSRVDVTKKQIEKVSRR